MSRFLYRWAENEYDRLPALASDLVRRRVTVIFAGGGEMSALAAKSATEEISIVFRHGADPVELGLVRALNRPGKNLTGVFDLIRNLNPKRLGLLHELVPATTSIALLLNPTGSQMEVEKKEAERAAAMLGVRLVILEASNPSEIETAFLALGEQHSGAVLIGGDALFFYRCDQIAALARRQAVPAIHYAHEFVLAGGLMSYGASIADTYRQAGTFVGRILNGEKPTDLPVQQPTRFEMAINLRAARAMGLTVPNTLLVSADEVLE